MSPFSLAKKGGKCQFTMLYLYKIILFCQNWCMSLFIFVMVQDKTNLTAPFGSSLWVYLRRNHTSISTKMTYVTLLIITAKMRLVCRKGRVLCIYEELAWRSWHVAVIEYLFSYCSGKSIQNVSRILSSSSKLSVPHTFWSLLANRTFRGSKQSR